MQKMILVDQEKCTGCRQCEMVCSVFHEGVSNPTRSRIHIIKWDMQGFYLPMVCQQCEQAPCMSVCPVNAICREEELSRVVVDDEVCIKCKLCLVVCPFGGMGYDIVANRVIKCNFCDGDPECVRFCDTGALQFVDLTTANLRRKRSAGERLSELLKRLATTIH
jgi:Fe-S-cluster-containing hydrogenase component 2